MRNRYIMNYDTEVGQGFRAEQELRYLNIREKMQLDVGNEPYLSQQWCLAHVLTWFFLECSQWQLQTCSIEALIFLHAQFCWFTVSLRVALKKLNFNIKWHVELAKNLLECSSYFLHIGLQKKFIVVKFQVPNSIIFWDMNYYLRLLVQSGRQTDNRQTTDRKRCIWAHRANCTGGLKKCGLTG